MNDASPLMLNFISKGNGNKNNYKNDKDLTDKVNEDSISSATKNPPERINALIIHDDIDVQSDNE